jgi:hypothetical protein
MNAVRGGDYAKANVLALTLVWKLFKGSHILDERRISCCNNSKTNKFAVEMMVVIDIRLHINPNR